MKTAISIAVACATLAACSSTPQKVEVAPPPRATVPAPLPAVAAPVAPTETETARLARMTRELANKSVYFEFDSYTVNAPYQGVVKQQADFARHTARDAVTLEGNADERGSREYNLALGQKRSEAVRKSLLLLGVPEARLEAISYGKEKPRSTCHEEKCWQKDRRVDFAHKVQ